ncbi:DNA-binding GntR family transcriptional regulator [Nocardioides albertanoniae]|uniref:DNA-binding GntR family transcriptional regulator n=1 Tax=Nocardioides albertanoniae TaxID=1175486 RepID=A0A543A627_9ACTN|nr:GntR family transcriptional regulator [Nocardioides albertanoniae]TQL68028.1 DNA-binding GntR family transcriptional regulator [Nocardioides albertanoniae]
MAGIGKAAQAYRDIERMVVFGEIDPGSLVSESFLMEKTGLGRTPVREALQRLSRNRMVEIHPNKGVLIPSTSVEAQLRMLELRRVLESLAVRLACERALPADRSGMEAMVARLERGGFDLEGYAETVRGTHDLIVTGSHNAYLADAMAPLQGLSRRFWFTHVSEVEAEIKAGASLHVAILRAILAREPDAAEAAALDLNDYLVDFSYATLGPQGSRRSR